MVQLFAHYTGGHHLSLYFDYTNIHYIQIHITFDIISYIAFVIYITQPDAISVFTIATTTLPGSCTLYINCTDALQMHFIYVRGFTHAYGGG